MRRRWLLLPAGLLAAALAVAPAAGAPRPAAPLPAAARHKLLDDGAPRPGPRRAAPGQVIVELGGDPVAPLLGSRAGATAVAARRASVQSLQDQVLAALGAQGVPHRVIHRYDTVFAGLALAVPEAYWDRLRAIPGVVAVHPDRVRHLALDHSAPYVGARAVADQFGGTGAGVTVGVIDTGIDYTHPDLGGAGPGTTYPTARVVGGHDFVGDLYTGCGDPLQPDDDPMDQNGHGTHVAGIIGARAAGPNGVTGVAPAVTFRAYKVFGADGDTCSSTVIAAIERAVQDGVQVINMSLGSEGTETDPDARAANNAVLAGVVVVASAGNRGPGAYTVGSPAAARYAIAVGAFTDDGVMAYFGRVVGQDRRWQYIPMVGGVPPVPAGGVTAPYVHVGYGFEADYRDKDVRGKIALIARGYITFGEKARRAQVHGAVAAIIYNNRPGDLYGFIAPEWGVAIPAVGVTAATGQYLLQVLAANPGAQAFLDPSPVPIPDQKAGFSSEGPTRRFHWIKPDVVAPGVDVHSTVPYEPYYDDYSGTSMAAPHVAGAAAILRQLHPDWTPFDVKAALMNNARLVTDSESGQPWGLMQQGAGMIRVDWAAAAAIRAYALYQGQPDNPSFSFGRYPATASRSLLQEGVVLGPPGTALAYSVQWLGDHPGLDLRLYGDPQIGADGRARFGLSLRLNGRVEKPAGTYGGYLWIEGAGTRIHLPFAVVLY